VFESFYTMTTLLSADTNAVVKLDLGGKGGTRRIVFSRLWDSENSHVSFARLSNLALKFSTLARPNLHRPIITYTDVDGDTITISTHRELKEAFEQFVVVTPASTTDTATPIILRAQASFTKKWRGGGIAKNEEGIRPKKLINVVATKVIDTLDSDGSTNEPLGNGNVSTCTSNLANVFSRSITATCRNTVPKVQVFIMMGQSNMLGLGSFGPINKEKTLQNAVIRQGKYPYLWNNTTEDWAVSNTVRNVFVMGSGVTNATCQNNSWMAGNQGHQGNHIGPELGIGHYLETHYNSDPVMMLKSCIGNRALGWDLLPPGTPSFDWTESETGKEYTYAGYGQSPERWPKDTTPQPGNWKAGVQYDGDTRRADEVLADLGKFYPGATEYEVAGFLWWQGDRDSRSPALSEVYESNLVAMIKALRVRYDAPDVPFVTASLGQSTLDPTCEGNCGRRILQAMLNVADATKYPEFAGNVAMVDAHDYALPGEASGNHYGGNADTYMQVGAAMGKKMVELLKK